MTWSRELARTTDEKIDIVLECCRRVLAWVEGQAGPGCAPAGLAVDAQGEAETLGEPGRAGWSDDRRKSPDKRADLLDSFSMFHITRLSTIQTVTS